MLVIVNLPQDRVITAVEAYRVTASIGPTSSTGWTTVWTSQERPWSAEGQELLPDSCGASYLAIDEIAEGLQLDVFGGAGEVLRLVWSNGPEVSPSGPVEAAAVGLTAMFGCPDRQRELEGLLREEPLDDEELAKSLGSLMDLPELDEPAPAVAAVAYRGQPQLARLAASLAGPAYLKAGSDGWTVVLASREEEGRSMELAAGVSGAGSRRDLVILIWRDGSGSGWSLWRRGEPVANGSWNARWRHVESDPLGAEVETVRPLLKALDPHVDENSLRALLRTRRAGQDPLTDLVALLGLPADLLEALDSPERFRERNGVEHIEQTSVRNAVLQGGFDLDAPARWPALSTAYAIGTVVAAGVCVAITMLFIVVVAGGGLVDRVGVSSDEWTTLALFAALSLILVPTAVFRVRRVMRRRASRASV